MFNINGGDSTLQAPLLRRQGVESPQDKSQLKNHGSCAFLGLKMGQNTLNADKQEHEMGIKNQWVFKCF